MPIQQETQRQQTNTQAQNQQAAAQQNTARQSAVDQLRTYLGSSPSASATARFMNKLQAEGALAGAMMAQARDLIQSTCGNDYAKDVAFHMTNKSKIGLPVEFEQLWDAHPHNYQDNDEENTTSDQVHEDLGWKAGTYGNTCAIRLSVMFNKLGGEYKIDRDKAEKAGIPRARVVFAPETKTYIILSAKEMWTYMSFWFGKAHKDFPAGKRFQSEEEFNTAWDTEIQEYISSRKGIVAFDKIFGFSGTGHVDIFDGTKLSDAPNWYACQNLKLWFI